MRRKESDLRSTCRAKIYPDGSWEIMACDRPIFMPEGWELSDKWDSISSRGERPKDSEPSERSESNIERAARRARIAVRDIARSNDFAYFVTLTLDASVIDRYDPKEITRRRNFWLDNQVRRHGLKYVLVPEHHKDGAIHFHGLFNDACEVVESGTWTASGWAKPRRPRSAAQLREWESEPEKYHKVYNIPAWGFGFSTAIPLYGDRQKSTAYICKYIGKEENKIGGRWYYSGGGLLAPKIEYLDLTYRDVEGWPDAYTFGVPAARAAFAIARGGVVHDRGAKGAEGEK